jgi:hypothetical protein
MQRYYKNQSITEDGEVVKDDVIALYSPFKEGVGYNLKYKSTFVKSYLGISLPVGEGSKGFKDIELGRLYRISKMMYSSSNLLAKRSDNCIVPLTRDDIQKALCMHRTKFVPFWKKIMDFSIIKPITINGDTFFCMNPLYYNSTTYLPVYLYIAFQKELNEHLPQWVINKYLEMGTSIKDKEENEEKASG